MYMEKSTNNLTIIMKTTTLSMNYEQKNSTQLTSMKLPKTIYPLVSKDNTTMELPKTIYPLVSKDNTTYQYVVVDAYITIKNYLWLNKIHQ